MCLQETFYHALRKSVCLCSTNGHVKYIVCVTRYYQSPLLQLHLCHHFLNMVMYTNIKCLQTYPIVLNIFTLCDNYCYNASFPILVCHHSLYIVTTILKYCVYLWFNVTMLPKLMDFWNKILYSMATLVWYRHIFYYHTDTIFKSDHMRPTVAKLLVTLSVNKNNYHRTHMVTFFACDQCTILY